jgi:hypothetical protein
MRWAYDIARESLPEYSSRFSRHDFTLAQLFACLVVKDMLKRSYRGIEAVLRDSLEWLAEIGMARAPDHNTLCRAAKQLLRQDRVAKLLDTMVERAERAEILKLDEKPLAIDSTNFESDNEDAAT